MPPLPRSGPSNGCQSCRKQKVKCNEAKPSCGRCQKAGRDCIYLNPFDLLHRNQNSAAKSSAETKWRQRTKQVDRTPDPPLNIVRVVTGSPTAGLRPSLGRLVTLRYWHDFATPLGSTPAMFGPIKRVQLTYEQSPKESCISSAVAAVSYANFHARFKSEEAKRTSAVYYSKTMNRLVASLMNPAETQSEGTLMAVFLLSQYETITSSSPDAWNSHLHGLSSLMAQLQLPALTDRPRLFMFAALYIHLLAYYIKIQVTPPPHVHAWFAHIPGMSRRTKLLWGSMLTGATLREKLKDGTRNQVEGDLTLLNTALSFDYELSEWEIEIGEEYYYSTHSIHLNKRPSWATALLSAPGAPKSMHIYRDILISSDWNRYRTTRLQVNLSLLDYINSHPSLPVDLLAIRSHIISTILSFTDQIRESVPFILQLTVPGGSYDAQSTNEVAGYWGDTLTGPLTASWQCHQREEVKIWAPYQAAWLEKVLLFSRQHLGITMAQGFLEMGEQQA